MTTLRRDLLYKSVADFLADVEENPMHQTEISRQFAEASFEEAMYLAEHGWPDGLIPAMDLAKEAIESVEGNLQTTFEASWQLTGAEVDMARYMTGVPECMIEYEPIKVSNAGKVIRIVYSVTVSSGLSTESMKKRGAAILALVMALEECQHSTEVWMDRTVSDDTSTNSPDPTRNRPEWMRRTRVLIKSAYDSVDPEALAYWLVHPSALRQLCFRVDRSGTPCNPIEDMEEGTIYLPCVRSYTDIPDPTKWIREKLIELGLLAE